MVTRVLALGPGNCRYQFTEYENRDGFLAPGEFEGEPEDDHAARSLQSFNEVVRSWKWTIRGVSALTYCFVSFSLAVVAVGLYLLTWPLLIAGALCFVIGNLVCCRIRWMAASKLIESLQERAAEINEASRTNIRFQVRHQKQSHIFGWMRVRLRMVDLNAMRTTEIRVLGRASHVVPMENLQTSIERSKLLALRSEKRLEPRRSSSVGSFSSQNESDIDFDDTEKGIGQGIFVDEDPEDAPTVCQFSTSTEENVPRDTYDLPKGILVEGLYNDYEVPPTGAIQQQANY
eukprot:Selendium_serpulae@DN5433_c0_g1_i3.p1